MLEVATDSLTECLQCNTALFVGAYVFGLGDFRRSLQDRKKIASDFTEGEDCCTPFGLQRDLRKRFSEAELVGLGWVLSQLAFPPSNSSIATNVILLPISSGPIGQRSKGNANGQWSNGPMEADGRPNSCWGIGGGEAPQKFGPFGLAFGLWLLGTIAPLVLSASGWAPSHWGPSQCLGLDWACLLHRQSAGRSINPIQLGQFHWIPRQVPLSLHPREK